MTFDDMTDDQRRAIVDAAIEAVDLWNERMAIQTNAAMDRAVSAWDRMCEAVAEAQEAHDGEKD